MCVSFIFCQPAYLFGFQCNVVIMIYNLIWNFFYDVFANAIDFGCMSCESCIVYSVEDVVMQLPKKMNHFSDKQFWIVDKCRVSTNNSDIWQLEFCKQFWKAIFDWQCFTLNKNDDVTFGILEHVINGGSFPLLTASI